MSKKKTNEEFILESKKIHGDLYDYSEVNYINNLTKVRIVCSNHGPFEVRPNDHLSKKVGCGKCNNESKSRIQNYGSKLIDKFNEVHNFKYSYDSLDYKGFKFKIEIVCPTHGTFKQSPNHHLRGCGCPKCGGVFRKNIQDFIMESKKIHGDKYDYSFSEYKNNMTKLKILCPTHGIFEMRPNDHLSKKAGCRKCLSYSYEKFVNEAKYIHNDRYDYSLVDIIGNNKKVKIICPIHGIFKQSVNNHILGSGCPICKISKGELFIKKFLDDNNFEYVREKTFKDCINKKMLPFDFYLPKQNLCIEFDGEQHFKEINYFGGKTNFEEIKKRDEIKTKYCEDNNIKLLRLHKNNIEYLYEYLGIKNKITL